MSANRYLLFATERYAVPILQPLADALHVAGHRMHALLLDGAAWSVAHTAAAYALYKRLRYYEMRRNPASIQQAREPLLRPGLEH